MSPEQKARKRELERLRRATPEGRLKKRLADSRRHRAHYERRIKRTSEEHGSYAQYQRYLRSAQGRMTWDAWIQHLAARKRVRKQARAARIASERLARAKPWYGLAPAERARMRRRNDPAFREHDILRAFCRKRRLRHASDGTVTPSTLRVLIASTKRCYLCRKILNGRISFDHVIPISRGGAHSIANLAVTHLKCNLHKATELRVLV